MNEKPWDEVVAVIGAGPVGCVLAALLAQRGFDVTLYEKRPDMRAHTEDAGRSINLVLTNRGLRALELLGVRSHVEQALTVPVLGRMMHDLEGQLTYQPYGKDDSEHNHSVSRSELNRYLLTLAEKNGVTVCFGHALVGGDIERGELVLEVAGEERITREVDAVFGADGAPSALRQLLVRDHGFEAVVDWLEDGYKEIPFPAAPDGGWAMERDALHIWPRGHHMLMGLANLDGSFTGTVYLPHEGEDGFASLNTPEAVLGFFERHYPDAVALLPDLTRDFLEHPEGKLGTMRCRPWHLKNRALLVGDAAHAIVPFFGQGLNCGLEDCTVLDELLEQHATLEEVFDLFDMSRKPNGDAIAQMALDNYVEMRDRVGDEEFLLKKKVEHRIEQELGHLYRSRYATVVYSHIPYKFAQDAGVIQQRILHQLTRGISSPEEVDMAHAEALIREELTPFYEARDIDLSF